VVDASHAVTDPFAPVHVEDLVDLSQAAAPEPPEPEIWEPCLPAPSDPSSAAEIRHWKHGSASAVWVYRDRAGAPLFAVARFDTVEADGSPSKELLPYSWGHRVWTTRSGPYAGTRRERTGWHFKRPKPPIPLYGLNRLAARPDAPVLICEGEKATDAASSLFPNFVCMTSQGGSNAADKAVWEPLRGRHVTIWPDNDQSGAVYAADVARLAGKVGAASIRIVSIPTEWSAGWDLADALPEGESIESLSTMLADASEVNAVVMPRGFVMRPDGLLFQPDPTERNPEPVPIFVAAPFEVVGEANDGSGSAWGLVLRWSDRDGRQHEWSCPKRLAHGDGNAIAAELEDAGLSCGTSHKTHELLKQFIGTVRIARRLRCVDRTGWHATNSGPVFLLPGGEAFGPGRRSVVLQRDRVSGGEAFRTAGTLSDWQRSVARYAAGNTRLALLISAAFAGPLLDVLSESSGGLHLFGGSQTGKTTALRCAASVWGCAEPGGQLRDWRATANGLEGVAAEACDTMLCLDEIGQADSREAAETVYMLGNGGGKARAARDGSARVRRTWRMIFLSTGEVPLSAKIAESGRRAMAGQEVRLVSLSADAGAGMGVFEDSHGFTSAGALATHLREASRTDYGTAGRAFLDRLTAVRASDPAGLASALKAMREAFIDAHLPPGADGQVASVCARFGLIAAAGELAQEWSVVPWPEGEAIEAAAACFADWLARRGGAGAAEDAEALRQVRAFIEAHGTSRFEESGDENSALAEPRTINRVGFRRRHGDGWHYLILPESWRNEVCRGLDPARVAKLLIGQRLMLPDSDGRPDRKERITGHGRIRVFVVSDAILGGDNE
jgi:uncharacterized protein (DUF927 family)